MSRDNLRYNLEVLGRSISDRPELVDELSRLRVIAKSSMRDENAAEFKKTLIDFQRTLKYLANDKAFMQALSRSPSVPERDDLTVSGNSGWAKFVLSLYSDKMYSA